MVDARGKVQVRIAEIADFPVVVDLEQKCFSDPWTPAALVGELVADDMRLPLVVTVDGRVSGYLMAWRVADQLHILNIATDPARQRQGLGTSLLRDAAGRAAVEGLVEITLEVRSGNEPGRAFYRKHGFSETGVRRGYYADNGEDAIIMTCAVATILAGE